MLGIRIFLERYAYTDEGCARVVGGRAPRSWAEAMYLAEIKHKEIAREVLRLLEERWGKLEVEGGLTDEIRAEFEEEKKYLEEIIRRGEEIERLLKEGKLEG